MRVVIAGGHGQIALLLTRRLAAAGQEAVGLIRNPDHEADVTAAGGVATVLDLESADVSEVVAAVRGADAVVFAAGAGPGSSAERKWTVDFGAAVKLADAAREADVRRYVMVSAIGADGYDADSDEVFQIYLHAKSDADRALRESGLDWTVIRPGGLIDDPGSGLVLAAESVPRGTIPRDDVAATILACVNTPSTIGRQFELVSGDQPIDEAVSTV